MDDLADRERALPEVRTFVERSHSKALEQGQERDRRFNDQAVGGSEERPGGMDRMID